MYNIPQLLDRQKREMSDGKVTENCICREKISNNAQCMHNKVFFYFPYKNDFWTIYFHWLNM